MFYLGPVLHSFEVVAPGGPTRVELRKTPARYYGRRVVAWDRRGGLAFDSGDCDSARQALDRMERWVNGLFEGKNGRPTARPDPGRQAAV